MNCNESCSKPLNILLQLAGGKWKFLIIKELLVREHRFSELKKELGCTAKVLTQCLREMESDGLVIREFDESNDVKIEYYLTDIGYTLRPVIDSMQKWGKEYKRLRKLMDKYKSEVQV